MTGGRKWGRTIVEEPSTFLHTELNYALEASLRNKPI